MLYGLPVRRRLQAWLACRLRSLYRSCRATMLNHRVRLPLRLWLWRPLRWLLLLTILLRIYDRARSIMALKLLSRLSLSLLLVRRFDTLPPTDFSAIAGIKTSESPHTPTGPTLAHVGACNSSDKINKVCHGIPAPRVVSGTATVPGCRTLVTVDGASTTTTATFVTPC